MNSPANPLFRSVVAGVDFSDGAASALKEAARLAHRFGAKLTAIHAVDERMLGALWTRGAAPKDDVMRELQKVTELHVGKVLSEAGSPSAEVEVRVGHPFEELIDGCESAGADLLVLGACGGDGMSDRVGMLASKCARKAPLATLLVRPRSGGARTYSRIVACTDLSENAAAALHAASGIAEVDGISLEGAYVAPPLAPALGGGVGSPMGGDAFDILLPPYPDIEEYLQEEGKRVGAWIEKEGHKGVVYHVFEGPSPAARLCDFIKDEEIELAVIGASGSGMVRRLLLGTTAERLLRDASCSVLIIKPEGFVWPPEPGEG